MIGKVAVYGGGSIGIGWAILFSCAGVSVSIYDPALEQLETGRLEIRSRLASLSKHSLIDEPPRTILDRIVFTSDHSASIRHADYVQEAAPEKLELKRDIFRSLDAACGPEVILASSSSAITMSAIAGELSGRSRCLIVHPGNPPYLLRVAEVVPASFTSDGVVQRTRAFLSSVGVTPVVLRREIEGFVFNRLQGAMLREAYCLVRDGVITAGELDELVRDGLGLRWSIIGPFETAHLNTRGGIEAHAQRMGPTYARMGAERGQTDPWTRELVEKVAADLDRRVPISEWSERVRRRDQALMALLEQRKKRDDLSTDTV